MLLSVNGRSYEVEAEQDTPLLRVLRDHLGLTGSKFGCGAGLCPQIRRVASGEAG